MRIKKVRALNFRQALSMVRKELGANAVVLSTEDRKKSSNYVEVTAAIDYEMEQTGSIDLSPVSETAGTDRTGELTEIRNEIKDLKAHIRMMHNSGFEMHLPEDRKRMFNFLKERAVTEDFALGIVERAAGTDDLEAVMSEDINVLNPFHAARPGSGETSPQNRKRVVMLIGPTGVGKTTTIAKLASVAIREGKKVALISIDTYKVGAAEQIRIYSRMIGIPLEIVSRTEDLKHTIGRFSDRDLLLVDTMGHNPRDEECLNDLRRIYDKGLPVETQLLLSAVSDNDFLMETHRHYSTLPVDHVAFTKTDEAARLGSMYNICRIYQKPVAYITTGQKVPGNIEFIDNRKLTNLILRTGSA